MLYVFFGDRLEARTQCREFVRVCKEKRQDAEYIRINVHLEQSHSLEELLYAQGLFERKYIVLCDEVLEHKDVATHLLANADTYHESEHMFVIFEPQLSVADKKKFEKVGATFYHYTEKAEPKENMKAIFSFADTFMTTSKQQQLKELHTLLRSGVAAASIIPILLWQVRVLNLVASSKDQKETELKPFVYNKAKRALTQNQSPLNNLFFLEKTLRDGRVTGMTDEEILENMILFKS